MSDEHLPEDALDRPSGSGDNIGTELDRLLTRLRIIIRRQGVSRGRIRQRLGWSSSKLREFLARPRDMTFHDLYHVLDTLEIPHHDFFAELWFEIPAPTPRPRRDTDLTQSDFVAPEIDRLLTLLRTVIMRRDMPQSKVCEKLGWRRNRVNCILSRTVALRFEDLDAILAAVGVTPAEFYGELWFNDRTEEPWQ